ncbi:hypothetical protein D9615_002748 [Tricholomella constricta]|uniref:SUN domain-containing protein n=1 Tax=Tricholomella constricta TaxID=117010 RepID=A0A8H5HFW4_9AGAR|nr:hypothetical protein D9615_002748 [Tricholomella constricta]
MLSLYLLPAALLAFLWASPVFAAAPTSTNDPLRAIAAQAPRKPDLPVCCLKSTQPLEPLEAEILLSFEEWKQKQSLLQEKERAKEREANNRSTHNTGGGGDNGNGSDTAILSQDITGTGEAANVDELTKDPKTEPLPPHLRVPLTDRFNYASLECSARVHLSHRSAKSTSSILSSKRDRYMLSPCNPSNKERQFIVVELCEDIRIDTVQLANFEFFSGIFKDFRISAAKTDITGEEAFTDAGLFRAKNVRGVQSFHPTSLRDFYRYIRIDFLSHYGNEYYCPVSLLRVYGLTHLEKWKWDTWEQESRAKMDTTVKDEVHSPSTPVDVVASPPVPAHMPDALSEGSATQELSANFSPTGYVSVDNNTENDSVTLTSDKEVTQASTLLASDSTASTVIQPSMEAVAAKTSDTKPTVSSPPASRANDIHDTSHTWTTSSSSPISALATNIASIIQRQRSNVSSSPIPSQQKTAPSDTATASLSGNSSNSSTSKAAPTNATTAKAVTTSMTASITPSIVVSMPTVSPPVMPVTTGGESIYRTIMNRLTALEANHTLYARYVEQQTSGVREVLRRLGEDVGRLEGIGKAQSQMYQRTVRDWEKRQQQLQMDYGELLARVEYLSDEIVLEKRLGIAQLCLLLAVLVFMGLTRGSRGDDQPVRFNKSMREWGKRHLSFSGDWTTRFRGRSRVDGRDRDVLKPHPQSARPVSISLDHDIKVEFPTTERERPHVHMEGDKMPLRPKDMNTHALTTSTRSASSDARVQPWRKPRSRTPSLRNAAARSRPPGMPASSSAHRPRLQRSNSHGIPGVHPGVGGAVPGTTHKSARKWARTAHLHEVRTVDRSVGPGAAGRRRGMRREEEGENGENTMMSEVAAFWAQRDERSKEEKKGVVRVDEFGSPRKDNGKRKENGEARLRPVSFEPQEDTEGDPWVDTELEESEGEGEWELKVDTGRSMAFSAAGNEH